MFDTLKVGVLTLPAMPDPADGDGPSLLDELGRLADTLSPSDVAATHQTDRVLGALVKVLDDSGVTVGDHLFPEKPADPAAGRPAEEKAANALEQLLARVETAVSKLEGHSDNLSSSLAHSPGSSSDPTAPRPEPSSSEPSPGETHVNPPQYQPPAPA